MQRLGPKRLNEGQFQGENRCKDVLRNVDRVTCSTPFEYSVPDGKSLSFPEVVGNKFGSASLNIAAFPIRQESIRAEKAAFAC